MRNLVFSGIILSLTLILTGCGDSGSATTTASAPPMAAAPPPPPPGPPAPPGPPVAPTATEPVPTPAETSNPPPVETTPTPAPQPEAAPQPAPEAQPQPAGNPAGVAGDPAAAPKVKTLHDRAMDAFRAGKDDEAFQMLATHYFLSPTADEELKQKMQWVPNLRRPALATRIGVLVVYEAPKEFDGNPQPIGSPEAAQTFAENSRRPGDPNAQPAPADAAAPLLPDTANPAQKALVHFTGEVGTKFLEMLRVKLDAGAFGEALKEASIQPAPVGDPNQPGGVVANAHADPAGKKKSYPPGQLMPGVWFLGVVGDKDASAVAKKSSADAIVAFEVTVRPARAITFVNNTVKLRVSNAKDNKVWLVCDQVNNFEVLSARKKGAGGDDPVVTEVTRAVETLEKAYAPSPLPAGVTGEVASKRISDLAKEKPSDPLPLLLEARYYVALGLLQPDELMKIATSAVGEDKLAQIMKQMDGADLEALVGKVLASPELGKILEGKDPAKLLEEATKPGGGNLLEKLFPKGNAPKDAPPAGERPAGEKPAAAP